MKDISYLDGFRIEIAGHYGDATSGAFKLKIKGEEYLVVVSDGGDWEHVSISHKHKVPSWKTMCALKDLFFEEDEVVMQLHPAKKDHINNHPNCLHLWRPLTQEIPLPPKEMVGIG
ncbi:hypothetical protein NSQ62_07950 [Solibacillus sp. FSL H8-0523]|uniref:DUF7694 domain-containing protein n=1 Tax=Solibacillus sp. FSL H8-0523 TaxID=2954511 RepID=UPI003100B786